MGIEVFYPLDRLDLLPEAALSTFFHEYIHFLQDITTTYGLINACIVVTKMKFANNYILKLPGNEFKVPIEVSSDPTTELNYKLQEAYLGSDDISIRVLQIKDVRKESSQVYLPEPVNKHLPAIRVYFEDGAGKPRSFDFGSLHIMETMCQIGQKVFNPAVTHDDVPYRTAELVAKFIYPAIGQNLYFVFALCEVCLMVHQPADTFYEMLITMKKEGFVPKLEIEIYDFVTANIREAKTGRTIRDVYDHQVDLAIEELSGYFTTEAFNNEKKWVSHILAEARRWRSANPMLILGLLKQPELISVQFLHLVHVLGTPLMQNLDGECWYSKPVELQDIDIHPDVLAAILEIYQLLMDGKKGCDLKSFCKKGTRGIVVSEKCDEAPWGRVQDLPICPFAFLWGTWKLSGKTPIFN
jgi:hypothetical protein